LLFELFPNHILVEKYISGGQRALPASFAGKTSHLFEAAQFSAGLIGYASISTKVMDVL
jgi:hypothetical protein